MFGFLISKVIEQKLYICMMMKKKALNKFLTRFSFLVLMHFIFKTGDYSFESVFDYSLRSAVFSGLFFLYWLLIWYMAEFANQKILALKSFSSYKKQGLSYLLFVFHAIFGFTVAFGFNISYRTGDLSFFGNAWEGIPLLNPELTVSLFAVYLIVFAFDIYIMSIMKKKEDELQLEKLKQENILAKYLNLKSQIEPHFLFNSLSVLSSLIYTNVDLASDFILKLSKILRYVIERNDSLVVPLKDEIQFVNDYVFLMNARFEKSIIIENAIEAEVIEKSIIAPVSLQLLIENAIKHNRFSEAEPLHIKLFQDAEYLIVKNEIKLRHDQQETTKKGLENLIKRFAMLIDLPVKVEMTKSDFIVYLPIINSENHEGSNI